MDKTYSAASYLHDIEAIRESNKVSYDDIELLTKYIALSKIAGNDLQGKTYDEILEKIKEIRKANTDQTDQLNMEKDVLRERMSAYQLIYLIRYLQRLTIKIVLLTLLLSKIRHPKILR